MFIGDFLKVASWVLAFPMVAAARMRAFFWAELGANALLIGLTAWAILARRDLEFAGVAFLVVYVVYLAAVALYLDRGLQVHLSWSDVAPWIAGLGLILSVSLLTWHDTSVRLSYSLPALLAALVLVGIMLKKDERHAIVAFAARKAGAAR
jgi:hypothetical protein